ncbi:hypothetical protein SLS62_001918 [Diatrype stigma]|uniref:Uncharacterized protein n=1 Tax=Diatrype stigma TaxID=117547 RepID=A0AAN9YSV3_9PEZI
MATNSLVDAFKARHEAVKDLQQFLERQSLVGSDQGAPGQRDALFATILFFINFALIDTGRDDWRAHMKAAGKLIEASHCLSVEPLSDGLIPFPVNGRRADEALSLDIPASRMRRVQPQGLAMMLSSQQSRVIDCIASDFIAYYVWSGTLDTLTFSAQKVGFDIPYIDIDPCGILPILKRTEANSYHSCPAQLLLLILRTSLLARDIFSTNGLGCPPTVDQLDSCAALLAEMHAFDAQAWADKVYTSNFRTLGYVDEQEVRLRTHIASTYRATACLYMLLVAPSLPDHIRASSSPSSASSLLAPLDTEHYAATILEMLSSVPPASPLFKYTTCPVWMTGVETTLPDRRAWVMERLRAMMVTCPWGMLKAAMDTLTEIWKLRDAEAAAADEADGAGGSYVMLGEATGGAEPPFRTDNWLVRLRSLDIDCLIV